MTTYIRQHLKNWVDYYLYEDEGSVFISWVEQLFDSDPDLNNADISWKNIYQVWKITQR